MPIQMTSRNRYRQVHTRQQWRRRRQRQRRTETERKYGFRQIATNAVVLNERRNNKKNGIRRDSEIVVETNRDERMSDGGSRRVANVGDLQYRESAVHTTSRRKRK